MRRMQREHLTGMWTRFRCVGLVTHFVTERDQLEVHRRTKHGSTMVFVWDVLQKRCVILPVLSTFLTPKVFSSLLRHFSHLKNSTHVFDQFTFQPLYCQYFEPTFLV